MPEDIENIIKPPYKVIRVGQIHASRQFSVPATRGEDALVRYFVGGEGYYWHEQKKQLLTPGLVGLFPPGIQGLCLSSDENPYVYYYCRFCGDYAFYLLNRVIQKKGHFFTIPDENQLLEIFRRMLEWYKGPLPPEQRVSLMTPLDAMLSYLLTFLAEVEKETHNHQKKRVKLTAQILQHYLQDHISEPTDLDHFAEDLGVSKSTLVRYARLLLGKTILQAHEEIKMNWAKTLLASNQLSIGEVASHVGYRDPLYFSYVFRKNTGISPSQWRRELLQSS